MFETIEARASLAQQILAELLRAKRSCGASWVRKFTHPRKFGNHVTVHRLPARCPPVRLHQRETNVQSHTFYLVWEHSKTDIHALRPIFRL